MSLKIKSVKAREIIDSRGNPTLETTVIMSDGSVGVASVPSGASTGSFEAVELRDGNKKRYGGKGVCKAVANVNDVIAPEIMKSTSVSVRCIDQRMIALDGTKNKSKLGANAILSVSLALAKANASAHSTPLYRYLGGIYGTRLPVPMMNILNGGAHASNNLDIQEFMIVPTGFSSFSEALMAGCEIYHTLKDLLKKNGLSTGVGDEGGFAPDLNENEDAIKLIIDAIKEAGYSTKTVKIALDVAASEWWRGGGKYVLPKAKKNYTSEELIKRWSELISKYPIISIEDPLGEEDYSGWGKLTEAIGNKVMLVGDDLFVTNSERLRDGLKYKMANAILIKPNQIGSLTETLDVIRLAKENGYSVIISHRSGETDDTTIADIAVAVNAGFIKAGAPCRTDRTAKYNRLLKIEQDLNKKCF